DLYSRALAARGVAWAIPSADEMAAIQAAIFDELCEGIFNESTRALCIRVIERLASEDCDGVVLGCTEIPLIVTARDVGIDTIDSTRLLAAAAVAVALERAPMPDWYEGSGEA